VALKKLSKFNHPFCMYLCFEKCPLSATKYDQIIIIGHSEYYITIIVGCLLLFEICQG